MIGKIKKNEIKNLHISLIISSFDGFTQNNFDYTDIDSVVIENTINSIPAKTFMHCQSLKKVTIPESVTHIEDGSFLQCTSLENIDLPSSITYIGKNAIAFCESLIRVKIPPSVTTIESFAFIYCSGMKWLEIPSSVTSINECAFSYCKLLTIANLVRQRLTNDINILNTKPSPTKTDSISDSDKQEQLEN